MNRRFFSTNRTKLAQSTESGLIVLSAYKKMQAAGDSSYPFLQEANFWYLSGINYPDWLLVIDGRKNTSWLIAPDIDTVRQVFDGSLSFDDAQEISGVDEVLSSKDGEKLLRNLAEEYSDVYTIGEPSFAAYADFTLNPAAKILVSRLGKWFKNVNDCYKELSELRAIKQQSEIVAIKDAVSISIEAFKHSKAKLASYCYEYEVEAEFAYVFRRRNAHQAFEPIVAGGKNACTLHYTSNTMKIQASDMLLIDAGARLGNYSADITRTLAIGKPTARQRAVHDAVRIAEAEIVQLIRPGLAIKDYISSVDDIMQNALWSLGLSIAKRDAKSYRRYMPHAVSHGLGLEVHESLGTYRDFRPGMVLTVEPGIYIPDENVGVRIEDDILVTEAGSENLTAGLSTGL